MSTSTTKMRFTIQIIFYWLSESENESLNEFDESVICTTDSSSVFLTTMSCLLSIMITWKEFKS